MIYFPENGKCGVTDFHGVHDKDNDLSQFSSSRQLSSLVYQHPSSGDGSEDHHHFRTLAACSGTYKTVEFIIVNDATQWAFWKNSTETNTAAIFNVAAGYYSNTQFSVCLNYVLVGQISYSQGLEPSGVTYRSCDTPDPGSAVSTCSCVGCDATTCCNPKSTLSVEVDTSLLLSTFSTTFMYSRFAALKAIFKSDIDNIYLFTQRDFASSTIGLAYVGTFCLNSQSARNGGVVQATSTVTGFIAQIFAHEAGHNWGMQHDSASGFIMASSGSRTSYGTTFSSTSIAYFNSFYSSSYLPLTNGWRHCLENSPNTSAVSPFCGNGIIDGGEQCDAG
jgi:hypothetical protein